jgi:hypothetical protein
MMNSKSQTTVELIIILAIVLLILSIIILMVDPFQSFITNNDNSEIIWKSNLLSIHSLEIGTINILILENNLPDLATIKNVTFTTTQEYVIIEDQNIAKNKKDTVTFTDPTSCTAGDSLIGTIQIIYNTTAYFEETENFENKKYEVTCN